MRSHFIIPNDAPLKCCSKCKESKPATIEFFTPNGRNTNAFRPECKACRRKYREANKEKINARNRRWREENKEHLNARRREWFADPEHKAEKSEWDRRYRQRAGESLLERKRKDYIANRKVRTEKVNEWRRRNPEKVRSVQRKYLATHPDRRSESVRKYSANNRDKARATKQRRRAREFNFPNQFCENDWLRAIDYFGGCCAVCQRSTSGFFHKAHADHWIPLTDPQCPGTVPNNVIPLCGGKGGCNQSKGNKNADQWLISKFGKRKAAVILKRINAYFEWATSG